MVRIGRLVSWKSQTCSHFISFENIFEELLPYVARIPFVLFRSAPADACVCTVPDAHESDVNVLSWNKQEPLLVTGGDDATLRVWTLKTIQAGFIPVLFHC